MNNTRDERAEAKLKHMKESKRIKLINLRRGN